MAVWKWAPSIAAGNTVVLKPSDTTPCSTLLMAKLMGSVLPPGVFNVVCGEAATGTLMVEHETPALASITGSVRAGKAVASTAAPSLKRVHLELGGKAPAVVFEDADLDQAAEDIHIGGYFNAGQDCTAAARVVCQESVYEAFIEKLAAKAKAVAVGRTPDDAEALYGPLNNARQLAAVKNFFDTKPAHARVVTGGAPLDGPGYFFAPTVVADLKQTDDVSWSRTFPAIMPILN